MTKAEKIETILRYDIEPMLTLIDGEKADSWKIMYRVPDTEWLSLFVSPYDQRRFHLMPGEEYFFIFEKATDDLLYVVDVTADSILTAISELVNLLARKF